jgi:hypothetical protein
MNKFVLLLLFASFAIGCRQTANTPASTSDKPELDAIIPWLKIEYYPKNPKSPAYLPSQPTVIPIAELAPIFSAIHLNTDITNADYSYCNLSPSQWAALRAASATPYPVAWSPIQDSAGRREVATVDLRNDVFETSTVTEQAFTNQLSEMENAIRKATGQNDFSLRLMQKR